MKISKKTDYALRALVFLAIEPGKLFSIRHIAEENDIPKRFLEHIMLDLKDAGWVKGVPGRDGGYHLLVDPAKLTIGKVVRFYDSMLAPIACVSSCEYEKCSQEQSCHFRRFFLDIRNHIAHMLDRVTIKDLAGFDPVNEEELKEPDCPDDNRV